MNRDRLFSQTPQALARSAFKVIHGIQTESEPETRVAGVGLVFKVMCESLGLKPGEVLALTDRMEADCRYRDENTLNAVRTYVNNEITRKL